MVALQNFSEKIIFLLIEKLINDTINIVEKKVTQYWKKTILIKFCGILFVTYFVCWCVLNQTFDDINL